MNRRACKRTSRRVINIVPAFVAALAATALGPADVARRATLRARGDDRATAIRVGRVLLAHPLAAQLTQIRCERAGAHRACGLVLSGRKFKQRIDRRAFLTEVAALIAGAFATAPELDEVDLWTTVPLGVGSGVAVSGDFAVASAATVFAVTVTRAELPGLGRRLAAGDDVFWDRAFAQSLAAGAN